MVFPAPFIERLVPSPQTNLSTRSANGEWVASDMALDKPEPALVKKEAWAGGCGRRLIDTAAECGVRIEGDFILCALINILILFRFLTE